MFKFIAVVLRNEVDIRPAAGQISTAFAKIMAVSNIAVIGYVDEPPLLEPPSLLAEISAHNVEVRTESRVDNMHVENSNYENEATEQHIDVNINESQSGGRMSSGETRQNANSGQTDIDFENSSNEYSVSNETRPTDPGPSRQRGRGRRRVRGHMQLQQRVPPVGNNGNSEDNCHDNNTSRGRGRGQTRGRGKGRGKGRSQCEERDHRQESENDQNSSDLSEEE